MSLYIFWFFLCEGRNKTILYFFQNKKKQKQSKPSQKQNKTKIKSHRFCPFCRNLPSFFIIKTIGQYNTLLVPKNKILKFRIKNLHKLQNIFQISSTHCRSAKFNKNRNNYLERCIPPLYLKNIHHNVLE